MLSTVSSGTKRSGYMFFEREEEAKPKREDDIRKKTVWFGLLWRET